MRFSKIFKERMEKGDKKLSALVGNPFYVTVLGPKPTEQQVEALKGQRAAIFVAGLIQWSDRAGQHAYELCYFTQFDPRVVFMCREHNGSVAG
jgi:hypothetical protein